MKRWWFKYPKGNSTEPTISPACDGFLLPLTPESLLCTDHRKQLLERIWQYTALSEPQFGQLYLDPIRRYASYVQQVPASESHHHAYPGGMLDHGLELVACSLKLRQSYLLPSGAAPEDQAAQADAWSAAVAYGALLHDIGKIAVDVQVEYQNGEVWHPWHGPLNQPYNFRYVVGRDYQLHGAAAGLLYTRILTPALLDWLSCYPALWKHLLFLLANHYAHAGILGELVLQADRVSTAQNIGGNPAKALQASKYSLQHHLLSGLRHLIKSEFILNQPGAAGWLTKDHLWLVSKTATDRLRAYLVAQAVDGIPSSNIALFNELQSHGLVDTTPDGKAIWSATVTDDSWQHRFTFLRMQPSLVWADETPPLLFKGTVELNVNNAAHNSQPSDSAQGLQPKADGIRMPPPSSLEQDSAYSADLLGMFQEPVEKAAEPELQSPNLPPEQSSETPGHAFIEWLRQGIRNHHLLINDRKAKIHTIEGSFFLVTPGIFQRYAMEYPELTRGDGKTEPWRRIQRNFESLGIHMKRTNGQNIWTCTVRGPRKSSVLNGYLLHNSADIFIPLPPDNPHLILVR